MRADVLLPLYSGWGMAAGRESAKQFMERAGVPICMCSGNVVGRELVRVFVKASIS